MGITEEDLAPLHDVLDNKLITMIGDAQKYIRLYEFQKGEKLLKVIMNKRFNELNDDELDNDKVLQNIEKAVIAIESFKFKKTIKLLEKAEEFLTKNILEK